MLNDGKHFISTTGQVLRYNGSDSFQYVAQLENFGWVTDVCQSGENFLVLAYNETGYPGSYYSNLYICSDNFKTVDVYDLPRMEIEGEEYPTSGSFVFANISGTQYYVVVHYKTSNEEARSQIEDPEIRFLTPREITHYLLIVGDF
jgi:hypothetical protein